MLCVSCGQENTPSEATTPPQPTVIKEKETAAAPPAPVENLPAVPSSVAALIGSYTGFFVAEKFRENANIMHANKITIFIDELSGATAKGRSVVAGNSRPWTGELKISEDLKVSIIGKEPGDDKYDGVFEMQLQPNTNKIEGKWIAYDTNLAVSVREFSLTQREFKYQPALSLAEEPLYGPLYGTQKMEVEQWTDEETGETEYWETEIGESLSSAVGDLNASTQKLTAKQVENLALGDLEVIRNTIFARHGYSFKNRKMREFFDHRVSWYMPISTDIRDEITELEWANIDLLKRYEEHSERYYDVFGR